MIWSLFPKFLQGLSVPDLAEVVRQVGLDTTNAIVRDGYWVTETGLAHELPKFVADMAREGIAVTRASTTIAPSTLADPDFPIQVFADCGVTEFRIGWFPRVSSGVREALDSARSEIARAGERASAHDIRLIVQLHHRTLVASPSAAHIVLHDLDPAGIGVELDPGNQVYEGFEAWDYAVDLLAPYVAWIGAKDAILAPDGEGRSYRFVPAPEGNTDWRDLASALRPVSFFTRVPASTVVLMPFYHEHSPEQLISTLRSEVAYLRSTLTP